MGVERDAAIITTHRKMLRAVYSEGLQSWENTAVRCLARVERFSENFKTLNKYQKGTS